MVQKIIQAALACKEMVENLENMQTIPGYIVYDEIDEQLEQQKDELLNDKKKEENKTSDQQHERTEENKEELQIKPLEDIKEEIKKEKEKYVRRAREGEDEDDDEEPGINPDEVFKGKKVKDFV